MSPPNCAGPAVRVAAVARYYAGLLARSHRYLPPVIGYLAVLAIAFTDRAAPAAPEFAVSAGALLVVTCWLTVATADAEDPAQRLVTTTHARGPATVIAGLTTAVAAYAAVTVVVTPGWSLVLHGPAALAGVLPTAVLVHLAAVCSGVAIGLPCSRLLLPHVGYTVVAAISALAVVLLVTWVPLVNPALRSLAGGAADLGVPLLCLGASAAALAVSATTTSHLIARR
ncbi:hypothetical protein [Prauserella rugosa]|uniref:ABC-2 type transport system permease protein n=1 Tax=Prauserella rugosa TaxID=43354 RepID=A0A660CED1_9PSEU|nr:hypothetical protein [Prauserella rugosa]KMS86267.1 hypothetical protein ACZ91_37735 [Streptomyces regensis]TWH21752.1 hypothetical protein JD82_03620 [Prauserella rugosa]